MPSAGSSESADVRMGNGMAQMPGDTRTLVVSAVRGVLSDEAAGSEGWHE